MKKSIKKLMALMLSLVMIFGCIPSFTNEASAVGENSKILIKFNFLEKGKTVSEVNQAGGVNPFKLTENSNTYSYPFTLLQSDASLSIYELNNLSSPLDGTTTLADTNEYQIKVEVTDSSKFETLVGGSIKLSNFSAFDNTTIFDIQGISDWIVKNATCTNNSSTLTITFDLCLPTPITEVNLTSSGVLATNVKTLKYEVANNAPYTLADDPTTNWYKADLTTTHDFSSFAEAYKKLELTPSNGYNFTSETTVKLDGAGTVLNDKTTLNNDGKLTVFIRTVIQSATISLDFKKPETYSDFIILDSSRTEFTMDGKDLDDNENGFEGIDALNYTQNPNDRGFYYIYFTYTFPSSVELNKIQNFVYRNENLEIHDSFSTDQLLSMKVGDIYCYKIDRTDDSQQQNSNYSIKIFEKFDFRKQATMTCPITPGTTVAQIRQSMKDTFTTTESKVTASFDQTKVSITDVETSNSLAEETDTLEINKEYIIRFEIADTECPVYSSIKINNTNLTSVGFTYPDKENNHFFLPVAPNIVTGYYKVKVQSSTGSKKYKADDKDTAEKISGSGKKGSKRIITPQEGRKVESVIVTDKDGNKYEVTNEGDGTYSFIQPGTNVDVQVKYKNRLIELTIGSLDASVDDVNHKLDVVPKVVNDRTMLPIRFVAENLGAKVDWADNAPDTVWITRGDTKIEITLGSDIAKVNGKEYMLDSVAFAENDRTYLPVRFVSEKLNAIVEWNEERPMDVKIYERQ